VEESWIFKIKIYQNFGESGRRFLSDTVVPDDKRDQSNIIQQRIANVTHAFI